MGRNRPDLSDPRTIELMIAQGHGQGRGEAYIPWLTVRHFPSYGIRSQSWKNGARVMHFFSNLERNYSRILDFDPRVIEYREQFPMLPLDSTLRIAEDLGIKHHTCPQTQRPIVPTLDFLITLKVQNRVIDVGVSIKPASKLENPRTLQKMSIERAWCLAHGIEWTVVTEREMSPVLVGLLAAVHGYYDLVGFPQLTPERLVEIETLLLPLLKQERMPLATAALAVDDALHLKQGQSLVATKNFIIRRRWELDLKVPFDPGKPLLFKQ